MLKSCTMCNEWIDEEDITKEWEGVLHIQL